jgi:predicted RND superfamily exporter protein
MIAASEESLYLGLLLIAIAVNVVLYVVIGSTIWYGLRKHHVILVLLAAVLAVMWWRILSL